MSMDKNFFEIWGQLFLNAAKTQKQMEDFGQWMTQGLKGFEQMAPLYKNPYRPDVPKGEDAAADYMGAYRQSVEMFLKSFREYLAMFDMVPKADYLVLEKKVADLEGKLSEQEETIAQLRKLMGTGSGEHSNIAEGFRELLEQQANEFQKLMNNLSSFSKKKA
jgi:uncharacterized coiled-coil protein SlyX